MKKRFVAAFAVIIFAISLFSCSFVDKSGGRFDFEDERAPKKGVVISDLSEYFIVRGDLCSDEEKEALVLIRDTVRKNLDINLTVITDWLDKDGEPNQKEILIGTTNRAETKKAAEGLGYNDFVIEMVGEKLVIAGGSGAATLEAVKYFAKNHIDIYNAVVTYPKDGYRYVREMAVGSVTLDGTPISEYKLYLEAGEADLSYIQKALSETVVGEKLEIAESLSRYSKYIIFNGASLDAAKYGTRLDDSGNLYVFGSHLTFETAVEYFCGGYFDELVRDKGMKDIDITWHDDKTKTAFSFDMYSKDELLALLTQVYADPDKVIVGETVGGGQAMPSYTIERYKEETGKYPAMIGIDLSVYGLDLLELSAEDWSRAICELTEYASRGGIISVTSHFRNPTGNWTASGECYGDLGGEEGWQELLLEGSNINQKFKEELTVNATFLDALKENGVTVLWNPLHESNGGEFWFSAFEQDGEKINADYLKRLWIYIYDYFKAVGLNNLVWVYSPTTEGELDVMYAYPGNDYVDIVGCNWVHNGESEAELVTPYSLLVSDGKIGAINRFGIKNGGKLYSQVLDQQKEIFNSLDLLEELKALSKKGMSFGYFLTYNGTGSVRRLGCGKEFVSDEMIMTLEDTAPLLGVK